MRPKVTFSVFHFVLHYFNPALMNTNDTVAGNFRRAQTLKLGEV